MKEVIFLLEEKIRIDKYLSDQNPGISRRVFQNAIENNNVLVNDKKISSSYKLKKNDKISILQEIKEEIIVKEVLPDKNIPLEIIFQNKDFLVLNKKPGISVHPSNKGEQDTLANGLVSQFPEIKNIGEDPMRPGIVHRLDKDTSGVMIVALNQESFFYLKDLFQNRNIQKTYLAITWGEIKQKSGIIESYIGKSNKNPSKQATSDSPHKLINPKDARTSYKVLKTENDMSLVELQPKTGRKHQLRIHLHSISHPIIGDKKYSIGEGTELNKNFNDLMLHAFKIEFTGIDNENYSFSVPVPEYFPLRACLDSHFSS
ncbi:MAG: RluA family pseudouridine synthase [Patescibacteria group bacterium]|jgi:23S rRNA pseudouridine1911/1915/1917 synthase|nr:RluA family pseudouridine synthase [Patescibacteria group bacterium]